MLTTLNTTHTITPKILIRCIKAAFVVMQPIMVWGPPGIGKSDIIFQIGQKMGREVIDVRLATWDPTDLKGIPYLDTTNNVMMWAPSGELPSDPDSTAILFLDELPNTAPSVQNAAYQLILNRRIGKYVLPKNVLIVAAGNREGDRGQVHRMLAPLASRFTHYELAVSYDDWFEYAINANWHSGVIGYLEYSKGSLFKFDPLGSGYTFQCPRTWGFVDKFLKLNDISPDEEVLAANIYGSIGDGGASAFLAHRKLCCQLPNPTDIITGKNKEKLKITEVSAQWSLLINLCQELKHIESNITEEEVWNSYLDNFIVYVMDNFEPEMIVMSFRLVMMTYTIDIDVIKVKSFSKFYSQYGRKYIINK